MELGRREFLLLLALGLAELLAGCRGDAAALTGSAAASTLTGAGRGAKGIGRRYLKQHPEERDLDRLLEQVFGHRRAVSPQQLRAEIQNQVQAEFAAGATVDLHGWLFSQTEARLCAAALLAEAPDQAAQK